MTAATTSYDMRWHSGGRLLHYRMAGAWDGRTLESWRALVADRLQAAPPGGWYALGDLREFPVQSEEINDGRRQLLDALIAAGCLNGALVTARAVVQMQSRRVVGATGAPTRFRYFTSNDDALQWLSQQAGQALRL